MLRAQLGAALLLLTRLPAAWVIGDRPFPPAARCVWAYPLIGAMVGAIGGGVSMLCRESMPPVLAAIWTVAAQVLLTGGLHEDGLADMADGFGGGGTIARKLEIMRDSRIGSYGVLALILALGARVAAIAMIPGVAPALIASGALSRAAMVAPMLLPPARTDGLGARLGRVGWARAAVCAGLGGLIALAALADGAASAAAVACLAALAVTGLARAHIGGFTGDVLGGCAVLTECAVLTWLA